MAAAWRNGLKLPEDGHLHSMVCFCRIFFSVLCHYAIFYLFMTSGSPATSLLHWAASKGSVYILLSKAPHLSCGSFGGMAYR